MARVEKIAILGGGAGSLAAAWYLSSPPDWRERYDITSAREAPEFSPGSRARTPQAS